MSYSITLRVPLGSDAISARIGSGSYQELEAGDTPNVLTGDSATVTLISSLMSLENTWTITNTDNCTYSTTTRNATITISDESLPASATVSLDGGGPIPPVEPESIYIYSNDGSLLIGQVSTTTREFGSFTYYNNLTYASGIYFDNAMEPLPPSLQYDLTSYLGISNSPNTTVPTYVDGQGICPSSGLANVYVVPLPAGYTITYETNGGTSVPQATGQTALPNPLPTTTKAGNRFIGWYTDSTLQTPAVAGATITQNTTLYAKWKVLKTVDVTTLSGWSSLPAGQYDVKVKASATGYYDSAFSNSVSVTKASVYNITETLTHVSGETTNPTTIQVGGTASLLYAEDGGYTLPNSITVTNATYTWDQSTGILVLSNPTGNVHITITGVPETSEYSITCHLTGITADEENPTTIAEGEEVLLSFSVQDPSTKMFPTDVSVIGCDYSWLPDDPSEQLIIFDATEDVDITITAVDKVNYTITYNLTHVTLYDGPESMTPIEEVSCSFTADEGYTLPEDITVTNAEYVWYPEDESDQLSLYGATGNVTVTIEGEPGSGYDVNIFGEFASVPEANASYSLDNGSTWSELCDVQLIENVSQIKFELVGLDEGDHGTSYMEINGSRVLERTGSETEPKYTENYTLNSDMIVYVYLVNSCLTGDTLVTMSDNSTKRIDEIELGDEILSYNWGTMELVPNKVIFTDKDANKSFTEYDKWVFDDGTIIKTVHRHEFYNVEAKQFKYMDEWKIGEHTYKLDGTTPMLVSHETIKEKVRHYKITGELGTNYFANGLLNGDRYCPNDINLTAK